MRGLEARMDKARFIVLWNRCRLGGTASDAEQVFKTVAERYSEPHRRYHTPEHIKHCLRQFDLAADLMDNPDTVEMSIWFHDVIYDVPTTDNELRSAELFRALARDGFDSAFSQTVYDMILITTHQKPPTRTDDKYMVDVDLSSFGLPWEAFKRDSENVRDEFSARSDKEFYSGHIKFMQSLTDRAEFFATEFFREKYEASARDNVDRLIRELRSAGFT